MSSASGLSSITERVPPSSSAAMRVRLISASSTALSSRRTNSLERSLADSSASSGCVPTLRRSVWLSGKTVPPGGGDQGLTPEPERALRQLELAAQRRADEGGVVRVDGEWDAGGPERRVVRPEADPRVARRAHAQADSAGRQLAHQDRIGRGCDPVCDPVGVQDLDRLAHHARVARLARVRHEAQPSRPRPGAVPRGELEGGFAANGALEVDVELGQAHAHVTRSPRREYATVPAPLHLLERQVLLHWHCSWRTPPPKPPLRTRRSLTWTRSTEARSA